MYFSVLFFSVTVCQTAPCRGISWVEFAATIWCWYGTFLLASHKLKKLIGKATVSRRVTQKSRRDHILVTLWWSQGIVQQNLILKYSLRWKSLYFHTCARALNVCWFLSFVISFHSVAAVKISKAHAAFKLFAPVAKRSSPWKQDALMKEENEMGL